MLNEEFQLVDLSDVCTKLLLHFRLEECVLHAAVCWCGSVGHLYDTDMDICELMLNVDSRFPIVLYS